uniref:DUF6868 family protein n=1 Tax=Microbulbifer agarilyticus TaxID=260552 RepID=UPI0002557B11|nr:hypothetical protein [Microbulbifer agarilyticus]
MITMSQVTSILGWASLFNIGYLLLATGMLYLMKKFIKSVHGSMFDLDDAKLSEAYFGFLANFKIVTVAFFIVPYLSLKVMGY